MVDEARKVCFEQLRHRNACSIDELKSKLRKLYVKDLKAKRERALKDKRDINVTEEDDLDFFKNYCRQFFGQHQDPWDADDTLLLAQIWEEIQLEEVENNEANMMESLLNRKADRMVCPICMKMMARLEEDGRVTCPCGLSFPLPKQMNLPDFESALVASCELQHPTCNSTPVHQVRQADNGTLQFVSTCESCQTLNIILESSSSSSSSQSIN